VLTASTGGAVSAPAIPHGASGNTVGDTGNDNSAVAGSDGVAFAGTPNAGSETANGNSPLAAPDETAYVGTFGIGSKGTSLSTQATATQWKVVEGLVVITSQLTSYGEPVDDQMITFTLSGGWGGSCEAITNLNGNAGCDIVVKPLTLLRSIHSYTASFAGDAAYDPSSATGTVTYR